MKFNKFGHDLLVLSAGQTHFLYRVGTVHDKQVGAGCFVFLVRQVNGGLGSRSFREGCSRCGGEEKGLK